MPWSLRIGTWLCAVVTATLLVGLLDATAALAQSASCAQLYTTLRSLSRNPDFRTVDQASEDLRNLTADERDAESAYIRTGCQSAQQQGYPQTPQCRAIGRQILQQRAQLQRLTQSVVNGNAVSQQREQVLQQIARFGCNQQGARPRFLGDSQAPDQAQPPPRRRNFLEELFGGPSDQSDQSDGYGDSGQYDGQQQVEDPYAGQQTSNTIRTVCVRLSDGYYWPISYATLRDYIPQDAETCQQECPDKQVDLYFYDNPGQEPEQMVNAEGEAYTSLPTAFAYRQNFDLTNTCRPQATTGQVSLGDLGDGRNRAMVSYGGESFPLPMQNPHAVAKAASLPVADRAAIDIPLPRPRPSADAAAAVVPTTAPVISAQDRLVKVGDKIVRVVGPDTPYAPATGNSG